MSSQCANLCACFVKHSTVSLFASPCLVRLKSISCANDTHLDHTMQPSSNTVFCGTGCGLCSSLSDNTVHTVIQLTAGAKWMQDRDTNMSTFLVVMTDLITFRLPWFVVMCVHPSVVMPKFSAGRNFSVTSTFRVATTVFKRRDTVVAQGSTSSALAFPYWAHSAISFCATCLNPAPSTMLNVCSAH